MSADNKYYTVGITGHRDFLQSEIKHYKKQIKEYLLKLSKSTDKPLLLLSPLADGADRIFIEAGKELGLEYEAIISISIRLYLKDFDENSLLIHAKKYISIDIVDGKNVEDIKKYGPDRDKQYFPADKLLAKKCDTLVALWDGSYNQKIGSTANVV